MIIENIIRILFILFLIWGFYLKLEQVYQNLKEFHQNFKTKKIITKKDEEDSKNEDNAENNHLDKIIIYVLFAICSEILLHTIIVYYFSKDMLICNWQTVYIFFEDAGCVNNTIGFAYYVFHPIITIFFTWIVFASIKYNPKSTSKFLKEEITIKLYILGMLFFSFWIFFSNYIIYFDNPYDGGRGKPNPQIWITEFIADGQLLLMNYLGIAICIFLTLAFIRQNEKDF